MWLRFEPITVRLTPARRSSLICIATAIGGLHKLRIHGNSKAVVKAQQVFRRTLALAGAMQWAALLLGGAPTAQAQTYQPGQVITTNFGFVNRYRWTNDNGQVFPPNGVFRLSDF